MSSIDLPWVEIKVYLATVGPDLAPPARPARCVFCEAGRVWFDGWRLVFAVLLVDGRPHRFDDGLALKRVVCAACRTSWTLRPPFLYPHRSHGPDVSEAAAWRYLADPAATYARVGASCGCSARSVWRWVGWLAGVACPAALVAEAARAHPGTPAAELISRALPQAHVTAHSERRAIVLEEALRVLGALGVWARAQPDPPADPSPLRCYLTVHMRRRGWVAHVTGPPESPGMPGQQGHAPR
jgi:hypothetical protein